MSEPEANEPTPPEVLPPKHIVVAGAGVVGLSTAYFLQKNFGDTVQSITLVDPTGRIAPAASGKAGGFLAYDWNDYSPTQELTHRSFALHQELANDLGAETIQYRRLTCAAVSVHSGGVVPRPKGQKLKGVEWAEPERVQDSAVLGMRPLGDTNTIAQVHPKMLCEQMWKEIRQKVGKAQLVEGTVLGAVHDKDGRLLGAKLSNGSIVEGDALLFACGPLTADFVTGVKYHSVVVPTKTVLSQCVFFSGCGDPEVYVRPDSTAYCTGFPEPERVVTERPGEEQVLPEKIATILESVRDATGHKHDNNNHRNENRPALQTSNPVVEQACYLPTTRDNVPVMGQVPTNVCGGQGCFIAAGHGCWGILLGPATGESMANLIMTGKGTTHVNLAPFRPSRFQSFSLVPQQ